MEISLSTSIMKEPVCVCVFVLDLYFFWFGASREKGRCVVVVGGTKDKNELVSYAGKRSRGPGGGEGSLVGVCLLSPVKSMSPAFQAASEALS